MSHSADDLRKIQAPLTTNLDEMSQQTLDALKIIHSFDSKPARSERIRQMMERKMSLQKEQVQRAAVRPASSPERVLRLPRQGLDPRTNNKQESIYNERPATTMIASSSNNEKSTSTPIKKLPKVKPAEVAPAAADKPGGANKTALPRILKPSSFKANDAGISKVPKSKMKTGAVNKSTIDCSFTVPPATSAVPTFPLIRTKGSSTTYSAISRLMQPTAASVAKANTRVLPKPASRGLSSAAGAYAVTADHSSISKSAIRPNASVKLPKPTSHTFDITNEHSNSSRIRLPPLKPSTSTLSAIPQLKAEVATPVTKTQFGHTGIQNQTNHNVLTVNPSMLSLDNEHGNPAKTSTPVRPLAPVAEQEHSSIQSIDYSNFSNFSYVADWANTPELAKRAFEQRDVDTLRLFGSIPPVDIEAIFGSEIRKQQRP